MPSFVAALDVVGKLGMFHAKGHVHAPFPELLCHRRSAGGVPLRDRREIQMSGRGEFRQETVRLKEIARDDIAHGETDRWHALVPVLGDKVVVAPAAEHGPLVLGIRIEDLEDHPGVVVESARDVGIDDRVAHPAIL